MFSAVRWKKIAGKIPISCIPNYIVSERQLSFQAFLDTRMTDVTLNTTAGLTSIRSPAQQHLSRVDAISLVMPPPHLLNGAMRMIVWLNKILSRLCLAKYKHCNSLFCPVVSNFLDHPGNRMLVGDLHKHFQTHALAHKLFQTWTFRHIHAHTNSLITKPTVVICVCISFKQRVVWDWGTNRRDDCPCCFPPVKGKNDSIIGKRWRRGGKVFHVPHCSIKLTNIATFRIVVSIYVCVSCEMLLWWCGDLMSVEKCGRHRSLTPTSLSCLNFKMSFLFENDLHPRCHF